MNRLMCRGESGKGRDKEAKKPDCARMRLTIQCAVGQRLTHIHVTITQGKHAWRVLYRSHRRTDAKWASKSRQ